MKLEKLNWDKKNNLLTFLLKDSEEGFVNAIRRLILEEVPVLAVEDVEIKENSSALYDEMIALRLGLSPIKTDLKSYTLKEKCKCEGEGCASCELILVLKGGKKGYVYATDADSKDSKCKFVHKMPIVKLISKQKVEMQLTAILGKGKEHAKWSPGWVWFHGWPEFKVTGKSDVKGCAEECKVLESRGGTLKIKDITKWNGACEQICEEHGIEVVNNDKNMVFNLESWGQLSCKEILDTSVDILLEKLDEFEGLL
ncbi:DNA-directed RNA polymerase subunit D [Candidatus Woesearchaeota archaeon]|nr:DNA-directed RNA polymerase subunit D [Candidatus Woesearchaeota archaeon]